MPLVSFLHVLSEVCAYVEMHIRHPRCASKYKCIVAISHGGRRSRVATRSTVKHYSMIIGALQPTSSQYAVSWNHPPSNAFIADREGKADIIVGKHSHSMELQFSAGLTVRLLAVAHRRLLTFSHRRILYAPRSKILKEC